MTWSVVDIIEDLFEDERAKAFALNQVEMDPAAAGSMARTSSSPTRQRFIQAFLAVTSGSKPNRSSRSVGISALIT